MAMLTVRNLPDDVHRALRVQAVRHGRSTEAEVREILAVAVKPETRVRLGEAFAALGRKAGLTNQDFEVFEQARDKTPAQANAGTNPGRSDRAIQGSGASI